ncbi:hypothetical protein MB84_27925 (plasmid) [Pandoraea oxalativorans]|uniref:Uncharacterized protein n=1 Tax=Pandoraea oxalativorans TaxID=573737 RepID=A0A0G3IFH5_9BURK|nr:hypothetical protein MB84_27925 [Pandoraea oxalativorans]
MDSIVTIDGMPGHPSGPKFGFSKRGAVPRRVSMRPWCFSMSPCSLVRSRKMSGKRPSASKAWHRRAGGPDLGGNMAPAAPGVQADDRACWLQRVKRLREGGNPVALSGRVHLPGRHPRAAAVGRPPRDGALAALM